MVRDLRKNFILVSMASFAIIMIALAIAINLWNFQLTKRRLDATISEILTFEEKQTDTEDISVPGFPVRDRGSRMEYPQFPTSIDPEAEVSTRFFTVIFEEGKTEDDGGKKEEDHPDDGDDQVTVHRDYIKSIGEKECIAYARQVMESGKTKGFRKNWRYLRTSRKGKEYLIFLNAATDLHAMKILALISLLTLFVSLLLVLLLTVRLSGRAVKPFVDNMERQKQFITDASHELKTPLTSISSSADVLAMEIRNNEWVENIRFQSGRMTKLIKDMVLLAGLDENVPLSRTEEFNLSDVAWESLEAFRGAAKAADCSFSAQIGEEIAYKGDPELIHKLFSLLLDNAVRYCDRGGCIDVLVRQKGRRIWICLGNPCRNHGIREPERLFDRFYRPDDSRSSHTGNYGIGLSAAKSIVEKHGGKISALCPDQDHIEFRIIL